MHLDGFKKGTQSLKPHANWESKMAEQRPNTHKCALLLDARLVHTHFNVLNKCIFWPIECITTKRSKTHKRT